MSHAPIANYEFRGCVIPARMAQALDCWIKHGQLPGSFLHAVLCNNLRDAVGRADAENLNALPAYIGYLYNEAPAACWGSPEKVAIWSCLADAPANAVWLHKCSAAAAVSLPLGEACDRCGAESPS